jgi:hypothetical protein
MSYQMDNKYTKKIMICGQKCYVSIEVQDLIFLLP